MGCTAAAVTTAAAAAAVERKPRRDWVVAACLSAFIDMENACVCAQRIEAIAKAVMVAIRIIFCLVRVRIRSIVEIEFVNTVVDVVVVARDEFYKSEVAEQTQVQKIGIR
mmetsp:Transcript_31061/g.73202  ORF Transcript_31061/g.73202 Transcript_31061/m.73202 type:complete len:110 (-) Transcript_31061:54-383(-)